MTVGAPAESVTSRSESKRNRKRKFLLLGEAIIGSQLEATGSSFTGIFRNWVSALSGTILN